MISMSEKLNRIISEEAVDCLSGKLQLNDKDLSALAQILSSKGETGKKINRKRALNAYIQVEKPENISELLGKILLDENEAIATRISAANGLSKRAEKQNEDVLIQVLSTPNRHLRREVIKALGRIGSKKSLELLNEVPTEEKADIRQAAKFARMLIQVRGNLNIKNNEIERSLGVSWLTQKAQKITAKKTKEHIASLNENTFGIELREDFAYQFDCASAQNILFLNKAIDFSKSIPLSTGQSQISAIIASRNPREINSTMRYLVISQAYENRLGILITRTSGELVYSGEAIPEGDTLRLSIRDVGETGSPTNISGTISRDGIDLSIDSFIKRRIKRGQIIA